MTTAALKHEVSRLVRETLDTEIERVRELGQLYERVRNIPSALATPEEIRAIKRGRAEFAAGKYRLLSDVLHDLDRKHGLKGRKKSRKSSA